MLYNLLTSESKIGPFKLIAMETWESICNIKEYCATGIHVNSRIRSFRA